MQSDSLHSGSISFGRFETEALCWERRSSFSHNRYLDEVEKYSKPGLVTEKKAYFEAHFKRKALLSQSSLESPNGIERQNSENGSSENMCSQEDFGHLNEDSHSPIRLMTDRGFENVTSSGESTTHAMADRDSENMTNYDESPVHSMTDRGFKDMATYGESIAHSMADCGSVNMTSYYESPVHSTANGSFGIGKCETGDAGISYPKSETGSALTYANNFTRISALVMTEELFQAEAENSTLSSTEPELKGNEDHISDCNKTSSELSSKTANLSSGSAVYEKDDSVTSKYQRSSPEVCPFPHIHFNLPICRYDFNLYDPSRMNKFRRQH